MSPDPSAGSIIDPVAAYYDLSDVAPLTQGKSRIVYQHPAFDSLLIKVVRPGCRDEERFENARPRRYSVWRFGGMRVWAREYDEYIALLWRTRELPDYISRYFGFCQTNFGPGMVVEKVLGPDGSMAQTLESLLKEGRLEADRLHRLVDRFFDDLIASDGKRCLRPMGDQVDLLKFQGRSSSILVFGWPAAIASRVAFR
ncbi:PhoP regulatory network YrbL family protein, partial [Ferrimonas balearica]|nr:PhoP regulatory network YrbL family protein [Ferrimonas balearica]